MSNFFLLVFSTCLLNRDGGLDLLICCLRNDNPVAVACNKNGDVFILDSIASCVHCVKRSSVSNGVRFGSFSLSGYASSETS